MKGGIALKIKMNTTTAYNGARRKGQTFDVPNEIPLPVVKRWVSRGICEVIEGTLDIDKKIISSKPIENTEPTDIEVAVLETSENEKVVSQKKEVGDKASDATSQYESMKAKELYALCKDRGLDVEAKRESQYYIDKLIEDDKK